MAKGDRLRCVIKDLGSVAGVCKRFQTTPAIDHIKRGRSVLQRSQKRRVADVRQGFADLQESEGTVGGENALHAIPFGRKRDMWAGGRPLNNHLDALAGEPGLHEPHHRGGREILHR